MSENTTPPSTDFDARHIGAAAPLQALDHCWATVDARIVSWLALPAGARVLDAGCGAGGMTARFAAAVETAGSVVAVDIGQELLDATRASVGSDPGERAPVSYHLGDLMNLPFAEGEFDLVWSSRVVHGLPDQLAGVRALRRLVKPGGRLVLREGGLPQRLLPYDLGIGEPGLEDRLQAAFIRWFTAFRAQLPGSVPYPHGWLRLLRDAGCHAVRSHSFLLEALPPFDAELAAYLRDGLRSRRDRLTAAGFLSAEDIDTLSLLTDPESDQDALRRTDLHLLAATSVYVGEA